MTRNISHQLCMKSVVKGISDDWSVTLSVFVCRLYSIITIFYERAFSLAQIDCFKKQNTWSFSLLSQNNIKNSTFGFAISIISPPSNFYFHFSFLSLFYLIKKWTRRKICSWHHVACVLHFNLPFTISQADKRRRKWWEKNRAADGSQENQLW